jgi:HSP20 family protein
MMFYRNLFTRDLFSELERLQRDLQSAVDTSPAIRGLNRGGYPAVNVGSTPEAVEIYAFAPGIDPASLNVHIERGVLTIDGERKPTQSDDGRDKATLHLDERFSGRFRRVINLPDDVDGNAVNADYRDGMLHVRAGRRESAMPRRIEVQ